MKKDVYTLHCYTTVSLISFYGFLMISSWSELNGIRYSRSILFLKNAIQAIKVHSNAPLVGPHACSAPVHMHWVRLADRHL